MNTLNERHDLLDLHSSSNKISTPFVICEEPSYTIANKLSVTIVSSGWGNLHTRGSDRYMCRQNKIGICIECGYHLDPNAENVAYQAAEIFLSELEMIDSVEKSDIVPNRKIDVNLLYVTKENFKLTRDFADFEPIKKGELIGKDGNEDVSAEEDCVILFPQKTAKKGEETFILGKEK